MCRGRWHETGCCPSWLIQQTQGSPFFALLQSSPPSGLGQQTQHGAAHTVRNEGQKQVMRVSQGLPIRLFSPNSIDSNVKELHK